MIFHEEESTDEQPAYVPDENAVMPKPPRPLTAEEMQAHADFMRVRWPAIIGHTDSCLAPCHSDRCRDKIKMHYRRGSRDWQCAICGAISSD